MLQKVSMLHFEIMERLDSGYTPSPWWALHNTLWQCVISGIWHSFHQRNIILYSYPCDKVRPSPNQNQAVAWCKICFYEIMIGINCSQFIYEHDIHGICWREDRNWMDHADLLMTIYWTWLCVHQKSSRNLYKRKELVGDISSWYLRKAYKDFKNRMNKNLSLFSKKYGTNSSHGNVG